MLWVRGASPGRNSRQGKTTRWRRSPRYQVGPDTVELPFTFFGFAEIDQPRTVQFSELGVSLEVTLKSDRLSLRLMREPQQLDLPLDLEVKSEPEALPPRKTTHTSASG